MLARVARKGLSPFFSIFRTIFPANAWCATMSSKQSASSSRCLFPALFTSNPCHPTLSHPSHYQLSFGEIETSKIVLTQENVKLQRTIGLVVVVVVMAVVVVVVMAVVTLCSLCKLSSGQ